MSDLTPDIPMSCVDRPTVGGLVAPFVNVRLADGGVDFRSPHQGTYERCWTEGLCQTCGTKIGPVAVFFGGPDQVAARLFDEPPLCPPCAVYASKACPMVAGRMSHYADRVSVSGGKRGHVCPDASCSCRGFVDADPSRPKTGGEPAHDWYALYIRTGTWQLVGKQVKARCFEQGCLHDRMLITGARLLAEPMKVVLVSTRENGRVWQKIHLSNLPISEGVCQRGQG